MKHVQHSAAIRCRRALAVLPQHIVCGESTSAPAVSVQAQALDPLREPCLRHHFTTHNIGVVEYVADHIVVMRAGRIEEQGDCAQVLAHPGCDYTQPAAGCGAAAGHSLARARRRRACSGAVL